ncbi:MAG: 50S ribosomal protein L3 N(5)-glutamine methyltransferase [Proteobacteria bacterium]|nr:MAG: 50S ribosomal protein L3 N(5)-glutamine methyltransferase [Pseudomonadota bacterium]
MALTFRTLVERCERSMQSAGLYFGHGTDNAFDEAAWLVAHAVGVDLAAEDELPWGRELADSEVEAATALLQTRLDTRKPLAYILGEAWFAGEKFYVDERVIVPRSHLGDWIPEQFVPWIEPNSVHRILDLCTGSACIAVALARHFPGASIVATDLSSEALEVAGRNVREHDVESRVSLRQGDLYEALDDETFDLIVCNPPYVADDIMEELPEEYRFEPAIAFAGGTTGLDLIARILNGAAAHLSENGVIVVEAGSAGPALENGCPDVPITWLATGGDDTALFMLTRDDLDSCFPRRIRSTAPRR